MIWFLAYYVSGVVPDIGHALISPIVSLAGLVLMIMGLVNVASGARKELPIIGDWAKKIKI